MIKVFFGENRAAAEQAAKRFLGEGLEVYEGGKIEVRDLPGIFYGTTLFATEGRRILLKDLGENTAVWAKVGDYADTEFMVAVLEGKIDKRSVGYKRLKELGVEMKEFPALAKPEAKLVFGVLDTAFRDGRRAVEMVERIEEEQDPLMFFGLLVTQMMKRYEMSRAGARERRVLKEMAKVDLQMKDGGVEPWVAVKVFLMRVKGVYGGRE